jgi:cytochrome c oxidase subunit IV
MSGHISPKGLYWGIFGALMVLTAVTVGVAFLPLGVLNFPVAITIAVTKATLVVLYFMHVKYSSRLTKMIVGMALFFLFTMFGLTLTDYLSRGWLSSPRGTAGAGQSITVTPTGGLLAPADQQELPTGSTRPGASTRPAPPASEH